MRRSSHGAALIIALVVLAALLFLALPFVFSQSASVAGAASTARAERANRALATTEQLATGMAAYGNGFHLAPAVSMPGSVRDANDLQDVLLDPGLVRAVGEPEGLRHVLIDTAADRQGDVAGNVITGLHDKDISAGVTISDEEAKLDPNSLSVVGWARLFDALQIKDDPLPRWEWTSPALPASQPWQSRGTRQDGEYGLLACAMIWLREASPGNRFVSLDDLSRADLADPATFAAVREFILGHQWLVPEDPTGDPVTGQPTVPRSVILDAILVQAPRRNAGLQRSEIARLSAYLTTMVPGRARGGVIDVGSIIWHATNGADTAEVVDDLPRFGLPRRWWRDLGDETGSPVFVDLPGSLHIGSSAFLPLFGTILGLGAPADPGLPFQGPHSVPSLSWFDRFDGASQERASVATTSLGIVSISAAAQAKDPRGATESARARRTTVQAVPQEHALEQAWISQAACEALVRSGHGSWVQSAPKPCGRVTNLPLHDTASSYSLSEAGWLEPMPVRRYGEVISGTARNLQWDTDWTADFGFKAAVVLDDVLKGGALLDPPMSVAASGSAPSALSDLVAQGLRVPIGGAAWPCREAGPGPLTFLARGEAAGVQMQGRRMAMWLSFATEPGDGIVLLESRRDASGDRNLWQVVYRKLPVPYLALVMGNAAKPWNTDSPLGMRADDPATNDIDERSMAPSTTGSTTSLAPAEPATRVEFRYRLDGPLAKDRWYHLQVQCAGDRPGSHLLIVDGVVGADAIASGSFANQGDHYTFPSLRLARAISHVAPASVSGASLFPGNIQLLTPPDGAGGRLALATLLAPRGMVRIDDEWFRYEGISGDALTGVMRGCRQRTAVQTASDSHGNDIVVHGTNWPNVQGHAAGAVVTPGWTQQELVNGRWYYGDCTLKQSVPDPVDASYSSLIPQAPTTWTPTTGDLTTGFNLAATAGWPERGYCWILADDGDAGANRSLYYHHGAFLRSGSHVTMDFTLPGGGDDPLAFGGTLQGGTDTSAGSDPAVVFACPTSIEVEGDVATMTDGRQRFPLAHLTISGNDQGESSYQIQFASGGRVQFLDAAGNVEWLAYHDISDRGPAQAGLAGGRVTGRFLVHFNNFRPYTNHDPRGVGRTKARAWTESGGLAADVVKVLPVQAGISRSGRFESGDVVTILPHDQTDPAQADPAQLVIRYVSRDAYPATRAEADLLQKSVDMPENWFAFDRGLPLTVKDLAVNPPETVGAPCLVAVGRGWSGRDLSPVMRDPLVRRGLMPTWAGLAVGGTVRLAFGSTDGERGGTAPASEIVIDDLQSGSVSGIADANRPEEAEFIQGFYPVVAGAPGLEAPGAVELTELLGSANLPVMVKASQGIFTKDVGVVWIDGEVFAYRRRRIQTSASPVAYASMSSEAVLIGRGLLGGTRLDHRVPSSTEAAQVAGMGLRPGLPAMPLSIGPVAVTRGSLPAATVAGAGVDLIDRPIDEYDAITLAANRYAGQTGHASRLDNAPFHLISAADGSAVELVRFVQKPFDKQATVAPWLRGLYGSAAADWPDGSVVIGWYPRFAPPLPKTLPSGSLGGTLGQSQADAVLRSRTLAWVGYPQRFSGMRSQQSGMTTLDAAGGPAELQVSGDGAFEFTARALTAVDTPSLNAQQNRRNLFAWGSAVPTVVPMAAPPAPMSVAATFVDALFRGRELDGVELRVHWSLVPAPSAKLSDIAGRQGLMARVGPAYLRCMAPVRVLGVEGTR